MGTTQKNANMTRLTQNSPFPSHDFRVFRDAFVRTRHAPKPLTASRTWIVTPHPPPPYFRLSLRKIRSVCTVFLTRAGENNCHAFTVPSRYQWLISPQKNNALLLASSDKWGTEKSHLGNMPCIDGHSHQAPMIKLKDGIALTIALKAIHMYSCILSCFLVFLFSCFLVFWTLYSVLLKVASDDESRSTDRNWVFVHLSECGTWCNESPLLRSTIFDRIINAKKRLYKARENNSKYDNFAETLVLSSLKRSRQSFYQGFFSGETL